MQLKNSKNVDSSEKKNRNSFRYYKNSKNFKIPHIVRNVNKRGELKTF